MRSIYKLIKLNISMSYLKIILIGITAIFAGVYYYSKDYFKLLMIGMVVYFILYLLIRYVVYLKMNKHK